MQNSNYSNAKKITPSSTQLKQGIKSMRYILSDVLIKGKCSHIKFKT